MASVEGSSSPDEPTSELMAGFLATAHAVFSAGSPADTLKAAVDLAVETIDGCDFASIFVLDSDALTTPVGTDSVAADVDVAQHRAGEGPAFDAVGQGVVGQGGRVYSEDLADDPRWVSFGPDAVKAGVRSVLTLRLSDDDSRGAALSLYAGHPRAFGALDRAKGVILAAMAGLALAAADAHEIEMRDTIQAALATREMIGQAQGILMEREHITADEAYDNLRRASRHLNTKVRDVAQALVDTGETPGTDSPPFAP
jgi:hypothetical protein